MNPILLLTILLLTLAGPRTLDARIRAELDGPSLITIIHDEELSQESLQGASLEVLDRQGVIHRISVGSGIELRQATEGHLLQLAPYSSYAFVLKHQYRIACADGRMIPVIPAGIYARLATPEGRLGIVESEPGLRARFFAPRAESVKFYLYTNVEDQSEASQVVAEPQPGGCWLIEIADTKNAKACTWSLEGPLGVSQWTTHDRQLADPWSRAVATQNNSEHRGRTLLGLPAYDWNDGGWIRPPRSEWVLYEAHLRDMSASPSSGARSAGSYAGFVDTMSRGGLEHLKKLGINAVEFLPLQDFGNIELDYDNPETWIRNTWNPWERNHWGYMTSYFFAPESWYASDANHSPSAWCGTSGSQVNEMKAMVDAMHQAGIAVVMDVVYNHVAQYDLNCFKNVDPCYWFQLNDLGEYTSGSGCGNDFRTARPLARQLILESLNYWVKDFHIDGFRFDLAAMIDDESLREIHQLLEPQGIFHTAEPWGGGEYEPQLFADLGWAWWNDIYRVDLRGRGPGERAGLLFGSLHPESNAERLLTNLNGHTRNTGGFNTQPLQAVNYIASHDDHGLADWIRIALELANDETRVGLGQELDFQTLTEDELAIHNLAAFHLLTAAGIPMLHSGQELGRSKLIAAGNANEKRSGGIDHNSYEKDNSTNWISWELLDRNSALVENYRALIRFRKQHPELASMERVPLAPLTGQHIAWILKDQSLALVWHSAADAEWELELPEKMERRLSFGDIDLVGRSLKMKGRAAVILEKR